MNEFGTRLYSAASCRELDRRAIVDHGIPGFELMQRAGRAAWTALGERWPAARAVAVLCGPGNNGGDGYVLAAAAREAGVAVMVVEIDDRPRRGDAATARAVWLAAGGTVRPWGTAAAEALADADVIVDALYGLGLARAATGDAAAAIAAVSAARVGGAGVLALDLPSGLDADTGSVSGPTIAADLTVSFIADKPGLHTGAGPALAGVVRVESLALPAAIHAGLAPCAWRIDAQRALPRWLPRRRRTQHKGDHGHVLLIGGDSGMAGAILLAGRAALRAGAGLVTVATRAAHAVALTAAQPELMVHAVESATELSPLLARADVVAIGPGLGRAAWGRSLFAAAGAADRRWVLDADALNLLAEAPRRWPGAVLTPHPGEAARLLGLATADVQRDRLASVRALAERYGGVAVLKGAGTLISADAPGAVPWLCPYGNPGMGVGGMGDVLTGIVAAFRAQGLAAAAAAAAAVTVHALAGDAVAARRGARGLLPSDLIDVLPEHVNP